MPCSAQQHRVCTGHFAGILIKIIMKKMTKSAREAHDSEPFAGRVHSGRDIAVFTVWLVLFAVLLFRLPFCLHMTVCGDVFREDRSMYNDSLLSVHHVIMCPDLVPCFDSRLSPSLTTTFCHHIGLMPDGPPPNLKFLLLVCGDVESNPGPEVLDFVKKLEAKVDSQGARLEGKLNKLIDMMNISQSHYNQFEEKFSTMEQQLKQNNKELQRQLSLLQNCTLRLEEHVEVYKEQVQAVQEDLQNVTSRLKQLEIAMENQDRQSRRSNLVLYGMREEQEESAEVCKSNVLRCLNRNFRRTNWGDVDIEGIHRLGSIPNPSGRPRPVLIKFNRLSDAMIIMKDREDRDAMHSQEGLRVGADLTRIQRDTLHLIKEQGKHAYFLNGKLIMKESRSTPSRFNRIPAQPPRDRRPSLNGPYVEAAAASPREEHSSEQPLRLVDQRGDSTRADQMDAPGKDSQHDVSPGQRGHSTRADQMEAPGGDSQHDVSPGQRGDPAMTGQMKAPGEDRQHDVSPGQRGDSTMTDQMEVPGEDSQHDVSPGQRGDSTMTDQTEVPGEASQHDVSPAPWGTEPRASASSPSVLSGQQSSPRGFGRGSPRLGAQRQHAAPKSVGGVDAKGRGKGKVVRSRPSRQSEIKTVNQTQPSPVLTRSHSTGKRTPLVPAQQSKLPSEWHANNQKTNTFNKNNK